MPIAGPMLEEPSQLVEVAKCNLGEVNVKLMQANPISCQSQANASRDLYDLRGGHKGLPGYVLACELQLPYSQLSPPLIFGDHYLGQIIALLTINYLQFGCTVELCGSLLWLPILPISPNPCHPS